MLEYFTQINIQYHDAIIALLKLFGYSVGILTLSTLSVMVAEHIYPKSDNHKKYKITHVTARSQEIHRP